MIPRHYLSGPGSILRTSFFHHFHNFIEIVPLFPWIPLAHWDFRHTIGKLIKMIRADVEISSYGELLGEVSTWRGRCQKMSISDLSKLFTIKRYDAVVHLAANKAAGESMLEPAMYARNNIIGGQNVINACSDFNIKIIIFSSSYI